MLSRGWSVNWHHFSLLWNVFTLNMNHCWSTPQEAVKSSVWYWKIFWSYQTHILFCVDNAFYIQLSSASLKFHSVSNDILTLVNTVFLWPRFGLDWSQTTKYAGSNECTWNWLRWGDSIPLWGLVKIESKRKLKIVQRKVYISFSSMLITVWLSTLINRHTSYLSFLGRHCII